VVQKWVRPKKQRHGDHRPSSKAVLDCLQKTDTCSVDHDQQRTPTFVQNTAIVISKIFYRQLSGIFHYTDGLKMTRFQMAKAAGDILGYSTAHVKPGTVNPDAVF